MVTAYEFRRALNEGRTVYGTLISNPSPKLFDTVLGLKPDFVFLCTEHVFYNQDILGWMCRAYRAAGIMPVVRILKPDPSLATQALDSGAAAILVPYAEDPLQVRELAGAVKYRPLKGRKLADILSGREKADATLEKYLQEHNKNNTLLLNIESPEGIRNMDQFFALDSPGGRAVDGIIAGPHDLSVSHGMPEQYNDPAFLDLSCGIIRKARAAGVAAGGHNGSRNSLELQKAWSRAGASIIMHSSDIFLFADKYTADINSIREERGESVSGSSESESV